MDNINVSGTCAVVGNSPIILSSTNGEEIDLHDHVIRCNKGPTKGIEQHTGSKTTIRFINVWIAKTILDPNFYGGVARQSTSWKTLKLEHILQNEILFLKDLEVSYDKIKQKVGNKHQVIGMTNESLSEMKKCSKSKNPTVGFCAVVWASRTFDTVNCFGFDFYDKSNPDRVDYHYFENVNNYKGHNWHNFDQEKEFLYSLPNVKFLSGIEHVVE